MSGEWVYVDESKRAGYTVAAVTVVTGPGHAATERALRGLLLPGQRSIHFKSESDGRKRTILAGMADLAVSGMVYERASGSHMPARRACLEALSVDHAKAGQIVLDMSEGDRVADEKTLREAATDAPAHSGSGTTNHIGARGCGCRTPWPGLGPVAGSGGNWRCR